VSDPELIEFYRANKYVAHENLFKRRHEDTTPEFHREMIEWFWSGENRAVLLAFRGSGKSTRSEEFVTLAALFGNFRNCLLIGSSEARAAERLAAISNELKTNDQLRVVWGDQVGDPWTQTKLVLRSGRCIQAMGRDQDIRGIKHIDWRPDLIVVDDFEDKDNVQTPEGRRRTLRWFLAELLPACDPRRKVRILATPMDVESVPMLLVRAPRPGWPERRFPIQFLDPEGIWTPAWPSRFSEEWIEQECADYTSLGEADVWEREYMVNAMSSAARTFRPEMIRVEPVESTFQARWAMIDPARTGFRVGRTTSMTGWAVWSWERHRLIVWEGGAKHLQPDEVVDLVYRLNDQHQPIDVGVEEDGLNEWLMQPLRVRQITEGYCPIRSVRAPRGKIDFIRGLQPFFASGEVVFALELPDLRDQLLGFPTGRIDAPNALAYALQLRPGRLLYDGWNRLTHIAPAGLRPGPCYLAANATKTLVTGVVVQLDDGRVRILADFIGEGDPGEATAGVVRSASMFAGRGLTVIAGPQHFDQWTNVGLVQAFRAHAVDCRPGGSVEAGREAIRGDLARTSGSQPAFAVCPDAGWTLRAFAGGYCRGVTGGILTEEAEPNRYRVLMEGLESLCGLFAFASQEDRNYAYDRAGRPYLSIIPERVNA